MAAKIEERFHVGMYKARRVVRTESNYCINQAELKGMKEAGFDEYEFISLGEEAENVCDTCDDLDGERFKISEAAVGVNCPPMHPFCRCKVTTPQETLEDIHADIDRMLDGTSIEEIEQRLDQMIAEREQIETTDNSAESVDNSDNRGIIEIGKEETTENEMLTKEADDLTIEYMTDKVMSVNEFDIADAKIEGFCLNPNGKHWDHFNAVGYTTKDGELLRNQLRDAFEKGNRVDVKEGKIKGDICFNIYTQLGVTEKHLFLTGWQIDHGTNRARFITAFDKEGSG